LRHFLMPLTAVLAFTLAALPSRAADPDDVLRATLPNGLRVVVVRDRLAPVVTTELSYLAGSNDAPEGFPGTAHALEHMMFRGSAGLDRDQLAELGALLGGVYNASTTETVTTYTYTVPATDLALALHSEALRMGGLTLAQADWEQERGAIEQEVSRDLSSPLYTYGAQAQALLFQGTPYEHDALGTRPSFDRTDAALLRQFYERWYAPNNAILVIAGDLEPRLALSEAQAAFGDIPRRDLPEHAAFTLNPVRPQTLALPTDFPIGLVTIATRMPGLKSPDFAAADILGDVLGSRRGALYGLVPAGRALMAQFSYSPKSDVGYGSAIAAFPKDSDPAPVLADLRRVLADIADNGVPPELMEAAKRQELAQLAFANDSISGLARGWSQALAFGGANSPDDIAHAYEAVTVADVDRLARELLDPDHAIVGILTPRGTGTPASGGGFGGAESFAAPPDHPVTLPEWASTALASLNLPTPMAPPDISVLPNGLRLIVQPEHVSHTVTVLGRVRSEEATQEPPGKEGVASLTGRLFDYGTTTRDRLAFRKAADDIAATVSAGRSFSIRALSSEFRPAMQLLAENELHPAFPPGAFEVARRQFAQSLAGALQSPDYLFSRAVAQATVPASDPSLREPTPKTVAALRLSDVAAYYVSTFRPDLTTMVVVGDTTPQEARAVVAEAFGAWRVEGPTPAIDLPAVGASASSRARVSNPSSLQDQVSLSQAVLLPVTSPDRYALELGNIILGSGFSSRLYRDLRVRTGYVYSVRSSFDWRRTRADYTISFGADGENLDKARALALRDLRDMQTTPVSDAELSRAKAQLLRRLPMQHASVGAIAGQYLRLVDLGLPLNSEQLAAQRYSALTAAQIQQAFTAWVRPDELAEVSGGPPPSALN